MEEMSDNRPTYRERRLARAERLRGWAEKREARATADFERAGEMASAIPFGQPILAGHYSQGRDMRYRERMGRTMDRSIEHARKAESMTSRAANIEAAADHAIYSDDPDAIERLQEKLAGLEAQRARIKAYNASCRKGAPDPSVLDDAQRAGLDSAYRHQAAYMERRRGQMPAYVLTNLSGTISTTRKRLEALQR